MAATPAARPPRPAGPPRRVVLTCVARRDAPQRLSLAFGLLARAARADLDQPGAVAARPRPRARPVPVAVPEVGP
jgi:hypothetical protein